MTTATRNEAAELLRDDLTAGGLGLHTSSYLLDAALAAERRATVERIRARLAPWGYGRHLYRHDEHVSPCPGCALDEESAR